MSKKIEKIIDKLGELQETLTTMAEEAQEIYDYRSERWQDSEKGEEYAEMISAIEDAANSVGEAIDYLSDYID